MEVRIDAQVVTVTPKDSDIQKITLTFTSIRGKSTLAVGKEGAECRQLQ